MFKADSDDTRQFLLQSFGDLNDFVIWITMWCTRNSPSAKKTGYLLAPSACLTIRVYTFVRHEPY